MHPIECPHCRQRFASNPSLAGQVVACPKCRQPFFVPTITSPTAASAPSRTPTGDVVRSIEDAASKSHKTQRWVVFTIVALIGSCGFLGLCLLIAMPKPNSRDGLGHFPPLPGQNETSNVSGEDFSSRPDAPFKYAVLEIDRKRHTEGPQIVIELETTNEVAKQNASEETLKKLLDYLFPTVDDRRVFVRIRTPVPGVTPWGMISRIRQNHVWKEDFTIHEFGIDADPYHFVETIDRSVSKQSSMIVSLPVLNRTARRLVEAGWTITTRKEDFFSAKLREQGLEITITPEHLRIYSSFGSDDAFESAVAIAIEDLGIADQVSAKLDSVIGSPTYLRSAPGSPAKWEWNIDGIACTYWHLPKLHDFVASYGGSK